MGLQTVEIAGRAGPPVADDLIWGVNAIGVSEEQAEWLFNDFGDNRAVAEAEHVLRRIMSESGEGQ